MEGIIKTCSICLCDSTFPNIKFDNEGKCSYCNLHDKMEEIFPNKEKGKIKINKLVKEIKQRNKREKYDCIIGISGGGDSIFTLWLCVKVYNLRALAVHYNGGFGNPIAGENMKKATKLLNIDFEIITSDWRETKDLTISLLKASVPDIALVHDLGFAATLFASSNKNKVKDIIIGQSWRTEGIAPLKWNYYDGLYLKDIHKKFGSMKLRKWTPNDCGYSLGLFQVIYYVIFKRIRSCSLLYYYDYDRSEARKIIREELGWEDTGAHYYDDLYQVLYTIYLKKKFNIDRRKFNYSALIRSNQLDRKKAIERINNPNYPLFNEDGLRLCLERLGISYDFFEECIKKDNKYYSDYKNVHSFIKLFKPLIYLMTKLNLILQTTYIKYFNL